MSIGEVIERLNSGTKAAELAKELNVGDKKLREALKKQGFKYNTSTKKWVGDEETQEYMGVNIYSFVSSIYKKKKSTSHDSNKEITKTPRITSQISNISSHKSNTEGESQFTQEEISALKEIVNQYMNEKADETNRERLHKRIIKLPNSDMTRKTVVIHKGIGERLDAFSNKMRFNKSDILSLALTDFLDRYENEGE